VLATAGAGSGQPLRHEARDAVLAELEGSIVVAAGLGGIVLPLAVLNAFAGFSGGDQEG